MDGQRWGYGGSGNLGDNNTATQSTPVQVVSTTGSGTLTSVTDISSSDGNAASNYFNSCVSNGKILTWGDNGNSNFGNNSTTGASLICAV